MSLSQALYQMMQDNQAAGHPTDLRVGTVTKESPLEITINTQSAPLKGPVLILTEPVVEKKIPVLEHNHYAINLGHTHTCPDGTTSEALTGRYLTESYSLVSEGYDATEQAQDIVCWEHGKKLPIEDGFIILNRKLEVGDKVIMLRVENGQRFIVLSRVFEVT